MQTRRSQPVVVPRHSTLKGAFVPITISPVHSYLDAFPKHSFLHLASIEEVATPSSLPFPPVVLSQDAAGELSELQLPAKCRHNRNTCSARARYVTPLCEIHTYHATTRARLPPHPVMISRADLDAMFRKPAPIAHPQHQAAQQYNAVNMQAQQRAEAERREKMRRIAKNPTDKNIPEGVEDVCIGDGVARYRELREIERTLDATMMRKKLDVMDSKHHSRASRYGTMRIWVSNTVENQPWQGNGIDTEAAFDFESDTNATYRVKIQGRLLDDEGDEGLEDEEDDEDAKDADGT